MSRSLLGDSRHKLSSIFLFNCIRLPYKRLTYLLKCFLVFIFLTFVFMVINIYYKVNFFYEDRSIALGEYRQFESLINADEARIIQGLGELGQPAYLDDLEKFQGEEDYKRIALNEYLSDKIAYNRSLIDFRNPKCINNNYDDDLPPASVVVVFHDEPYSVMVRTVWSILNTGGKYVHEVVLVDDCSTLPVLKNKLDYYVKTRFPANMVKIVRLEERSGLIRARLAGAKVVKSGVLVFLDAHCECIKVWLQPLLQRIKEDRHAVVMPIIDIIDSKTLQYRSTGLNFQVGGFLFNGDFKWIWVSDSELKRRKSDISPIRSPTMAGGLFAIDLDYFWEIGSYDEQMEGWGGENIEMSFRIWQCGGSLEIIPCSRVGHIFREFRPYSMPTTRNTNEINLARAAMVWMDEYVNLFFSHRKDIEGSPDIGDLTDRQLLRQQLNCNTFEWYLKNIYPEKFIPGTNVIGYGRFKNPNSGLCIDTLGIRSNGPLGVYSCNPNLEFSQHFSLTQNKELRTEELCSQIQNNREENGTRFVVMSDCIEKKMDQKWQLLKSNQIQHFMTNLCLDTTGLKSGDQLIAIQCDPNLKNQRWLIEFNEKNQLGAVSSDFGLNDENFGAFQDENGI